MLEERMVRLDRGKRKRRRREDERGNGRKEEGEIKGRMVAAGQEKNVAQWQQEGLALFHTWKKLGLPVLLLSSSSFNSRNLKADGTPGQLCVSLLLEDTLKHVEYRLKAASVLDSCFYCSPTVSVHKPIFVLLVSWPGLTLWSLHFDLVDGFM